MDDQYVVRSTRLAVRTSLPTLVVVAAYAGFSRWTGDFGLFGVVTLLLVVVTWLQVQRTWTLLRVDRVGIAMTVPAPSRFAASVLREAPWTSVWRLELDVARSAVVVVLRPDAPSPGWPTASVVPGDPRSGARYERVVPGLDGRACERVVRNVAPGTQVRVTG
jgi:hypothetical protein